MRIWYVCNVQVKVTTSCSDRIPTFYSGQCAERSSFWTNVAVEQQLWSWRSFVDFISTFSGIWPRAPQENIYAFSMFVHVNVQWMLDGNPGLRKTVRFNRRLQIQRHRGDASLCLNRDRRMEVGGGGLGGGGRQQAGAEGAASLTQNCSLFGLHHIHLSDPLPLWLGRRQKVVAEIRTLRAHRLGEKKMKPCGREQRGRARERYR